MMHIGFKLVFAGKLERGRHVQKVLEHPPAGGDLWAGIMVLVTAMG